MQLISKDNISGRIKYLVGSEDIMDNMGNVRTLEPFDERVLDFMDSLSRKLLKNTEAKKYPDIITFAFWIRKASLMELRKRIENSNENIIRVGRGVLFHIAPSNVAVNYAYSLAAGILTGNCNIVRVSSKYFPQVKIINDEIIKTIEEVSDDLEYSMKNRICIVQYEHIKEINDYLSDMADVRIIWGGDRTIEEVRRSDLNSMATEVIFADRFSVAVIDADFYISADNKKKIAQDFYNDTFLTDQNACTSPRMVIWLGDKEKVADAQDIFWENVHDVTAEKYNYQDIMGVNKLVQAYMCAVCFDDIKLITSEDNIITRVRLEDIPENLMDYKESTGFFFEYVSDDMSELRGILNKRRCQTVSYLGDISGIRKIIKSGIKGIDRIVPMGKTMDFDLIWDGYNLVDRFTRVIKDMI